MKSILPVLILFITLTTLQSCLEDSCNEQRTFIQYTPVYMTKAQFRKNISPSDTRPLENPGKMYFYKQYLFINEMGKGIHIFDMSDDSNPVKLTFYDIPGNFDISAKDNIIYADNAIDLIAIDITDILQPKIVKRIEDYKGLYSTYDPSFYYVYSIKSNQTLTLDCTDNNFNRVSFIQKNNFNVDASFDPKSTVISASGTGVGGSFARFTVVDDFLYIAEDFHIKSYSVTNPANPELKSNNQLGWGIETIFPYKDKLFVGSNSGMFILDIATPEYPVLLSSFNHARACDPVIVHENTAYITLRNGTACQGFINQLDVVDITNIMEPKLIKSYPMTHPHGLSYSDGYIYLAEGKNGFKILNAKKENDIKTIGEVKNIHSYDMISIAKDRLFMIGDDGFYQYNVSDPAEPKLKSCIKINQ